jgi:hypothetical protein
LQGIAQHPQPRALVRWHRARRDRPPVEPATQIFSERTHRRVALRRFLAQCLERDDFEITWRLLAVEDIAAHPVARGEQRPLRGGETLGGIRQETPRQAMRVASLREPRRGVRWREWTCRTKATLTLRIWLMDGRRLVSLNHDETARRRCPTIAFVIPLKS